MKNELYYIKKETSPGVWEVVAVGSVPEWVEFGAVKLTDEPFDIDNYQKFKQEGDSWLPQIAEVVEQDYCSCQRTRHILDEYCRGEQPFPDK